MRAALAPRAAQRSARTARRCRPLTRLLHSPSPSACPAPWPAPPPQAKWEASDNKPGLVATGVVGLTGLYLVSGLVNT